MRYPRKKILGVSVGVSFAFIFLFVAEYLVYSIKGFSFFTFLQSGNIIPLVVFICGAVIGMAWEYVGQFGFKWWHYPSVEEHWSLLVALPVFWGIFMVIMQDMYAVFRILGFGSVVAVIISTLITGLLIEGVNLYTRSWIYTGWLSFPLALIAGWLIFLSYTFVLGFNAHIINIFGL